MSEGAHRGALEGAADGRREIDHTADLGFEIWAADLDRLHRQATLALCELCYERSGVSRVGSRSLRVTGVSPEERLVRWLQEVYLLVEQEGWLTADVDRMRSEGESLSGTLVGELLDRSRHTLHTEIKAITYHEMAIEQDASGLWRTTVIVDV